MVMALQAWFKENKSFPDSVLVDRSAIGKSDYNTLVSSEVTQIEQAFKAVGEKLGVKCEPGLAYFAVGKKIDQKYSK
jgi:hypothetical protein